MIYHGAAGRAGLISVVKKDSLIIRTEELNDACNHISIKTRTRLFR